MPDLESDEDGLILVVVLWALIVLSVLAAGFAIATRTYTRAAFNIATSTRLAAAADAGINRAILQLIDPVRRTERIDGLAFPYSCRFNDEVTLAVRVTDESGKIDLNYGDERLLRKLITAAGMSNADAAATVDRIVDFRDSDDLRRPFGAEAPDYRAVGLGYGPANRELLSIDELEQVSHLPTNLVAAIRPFVTVHSRLTGIDPDVADAGLLRALSGGKLGLHASNSPRQVTLIWEALALPAELRMHTSRTAYSISAVAHGNSGGRIVRDVVVSLRPDGTFATVVWQRGEAAPSGISPTDVKCR